jgi:hypothetical protein
MDISQISLLKLKIFLGFALTLTAIIIIITVWLISKHKRNKILKNAPELNELNMSKINYDKDYVERRDLIKNARIGEGIKGGEVEGTSGTQGEIRENERNRSFEEREIERVREEIRRLEEES